MKTLAKQFLALLLALTLVAAPALAQNTQKNPQDTKKKPKDDVEQIGNRDVDCSINFYGIEREVALGKQFAQEIERSVKLVDDPVVNEYVNRVGQRLVRNSDAKVPFTIKVIESDQLNAFALPGGFFYVNTGLIMAATEESELAGVMAHEIAHVTARHGTCNATRGQLVQFAMIPLMIFGPGGWAGYGLYQGLNFLIPLQFLAFNRGAERQADYLGLQYLYKTGYDPNGYIAFFEKIQAQEKKRPGSIPKVFSTHPPSGERIQNAQNTIATILPTREEYIVSTSEFDMVKARLFEIQSVSKAQEDDPNRPTLRKRTERESDKKDSKTEEKDDDRPVLKRRPN